MSKRASLNRAIKGFTLIELIFTIGMMAMATLVVGVSINQVVSYSRYKEAYEMFHQEMDLLQVGLSRRCTDIIKAYNDEPEPNVYVSANLKAAGHAQPTDVIIVSNGTRVFRGVPWNNPTLAPQKKGELQIDKINVELLPDRKFLYASGALLSVKASIPNWAPYAATSSLVREFPIVTSLINEGTQNKMNQCALNETPESDIIAFTGINIDPKQVTDILARVLCNQNLPQTVAGNGYPADAGGGIRCVFAAKAAIPE